MSAAHEPARAARSALHHLARSSADHRVTLQQIGVRRLRLLGTRDTLVDDTCGEVRFRVGPSSPHRKVIVVLRADDTYAVEVGRLIWDDCLPAWVSEAADGIHQGVDAGQLGDAIDRLYRQVST